MTRHLAPLPLAALMVLAGSVTLGAQSASPTRNNAARIATPTVVLVHGAFADGSGWHRVIPLLEKDGYNVIAVQNPLTSFNADVETTKRVFNAQLGPVIAVGHSYAGAVITEAAAASPKVKALVYVAAFAPEAGEAIGAFGEKYPNALGSALKPDAAGFLYIDRARFHDVFAKDIPETEAHIAAVAQKPIIGTVFGTAVTRAAWKTIPSWYLVTRQDQAISPDLQRFYAKRMGAKVVEVNSSHVAFLSQPDAVARIIKQAVSATVEVASR